MTDLNRHRILKHFIATVWLANGLVCKVLNLVPRHQQIVAKILSVNNARLLTFLIGISEIGMAVWILTGIRTRINAMTQIVIIAAMNSLEILIAPDLLLWGKANAAFASMFILSIFYNEFYLNKKLALQT